MNIYYVTNELGYWVNPIHAYRQNWFTSKEDAENRKETFENWFIFNNSEYTVHSIDIPIDTEEHKVEYYSNTISKTILENTTSNIDAKILMLECEIEYADIDTLIYYFNKRFENVTMRDLPPAVNANSLKEFVLDFVLPYEQAYFNNMIDDFFGTK